MKKTIAGALALIIILHASAQELSKDDYKRAVSFLWSNLANKKVFNINTQYTWFADSSGLSFFVQSKEGRLFNHLNLQTKKTEPLFDHQRLSSLLTDSLKKEIKPGDLPFYTVKRPDKNHLEFTIDGKDYLLDLHNYSLSQKKKENDNPLEEKSPDGKWIAYSKDYNLYIRSADGKDVKQLSHDGIKNYEYAS